MCTSMLSCFGMFVVEGLLTGGGIGEFLSGSLGNAPPISSPFTLGRYVFDLAFFVVVSTLLLNLIFGMIIDTFSSLRESAREQAMLQNNKCIVCGLTRHDFERREFGGWKEHYKKEHNIWAYYAFMLHLKTKPSAEYTGLEDYVSSCIARDSLEWLPRNRAIVLELSGKDYQEE